MMKITYSKHLYSDFNSLRQPSFHLVTAYAGHIHFGQLSIPFKFLPDFDRFVIDAHYHDWTDDIISYIRNQEKLRELLKND